MKKWLSTKHYHSEHRKLVHVKNKKTKERGYAIYVGGIGWLTDMKSRITHFDNKTFIN